MLKRAALTASCCLILGGCGSYDLAGMPRVVANGGFVRTPETKAAEDRATLENHRRELELQALESRQGAQLALAAGIEAQRARLAGQAEQLRGLQAPTPEQRERLARLDNRIDALEADLERVHDLQGEALDEERALRSRPVLVQDQGPSRIAVADTPPNQLEGFRERFVRYALVAQANGATDQDIARMLQSGYLLIQSNCDDFFSRAAIVQRDADIGRDMIAPIITLLTGIVAARNLTQDSSDDLLHVFNIAGNAAVAGISIVDKHFLFGSENIVEVRDLTFEGFEEMEEEITAQGPISFEGAARRLIDYQLICTPAYILRLTREAIAHGDVVPDSNAPASADDRARAELAQELGRQGSLTDRQTLALWKLYMEDASAQDLPDTLVAGIGELGLGSLVVPAQAGPPPVKAKLSDAGTEHQADIRRILLTLSRPAQDHYRETPFPAPAAAENDAPGLQADFGGRRDLSGAPALRPSGRRVRLRVQ